MKKILLIMPLSYKYYEDIIETLRLYNFEIIFIPDFDESFLKRSIRYVNKKIIVYIQNKYIQDKIRKLDGNDFEYIFIIRGYGFSYNTINLLKKRFSNTKFILYQWDPLSISGFDPTALRIFDKCFTFDIKDSEKYKEMSYLPLFYKKNTDEIAEIKYDFSFIGAGHSNRLLILGKLLKDIEKKGYNYYAKIYINRFSYYFRYIMNIPGYRDFPKEQLSFTPIPRPLAQNVISQSNIVIDISHPLQSGLSIRVIEVLSSGRKLLTTNKSILKEPFYSNGIIGIIDDCKLPENIEALYKSKEVADISCLYINNWLKNFI